MTKHHDQGDLQKKGLANLGYGSRGLESMMAEQDLAAHIFIYKQEAESTVGVA